MGVEQFTFVSQFALINEPFSYCFDRTTHEFLFGALAELLDNARFKMFLYFRLKF